MQVGGGISPANALQWLEAGASHVIVTSWLFPKGREGKADLDLERLRELSGLVGPDKLVIDLSCRKIQNGNAEDGWYVAIDRWQTVTPVRLDEDLFRTLDPWCAEYLIHAADVEGLRQGPDWDLVRHLARVTDKPVTYAGGASSLRDLERMEHDSGGFVDLTIGSALDIFGGGEIRFEDCVAFNRERTE
jgi:phosphoribosylformimino-5-aminoimidazole carboxamide ribotide isomerase